MCRREAGGDALAKSQCGAVGLNPRRALRGGKCCSRHDLPARQWCRLNNCQQALQHAWARRGVWAQPGLIPGGGQYMVVK